MSLEDEELLPPPEAVWHLLTDAHCHPTDDPRPWKNIDALTQKLADVPIGNICAMSTSSKDQHLVSQLADRLADKITPAFGYHPWFVHLISCSSFDDPKDHYRNLFKGEKNRVELEELLPGLPDPISLSTILATLRANLERHPNAILGEVGIDRVFRLPSDPRGWTREPEQTANSHTLARRDRPLTNLYTPLDHQMHIIKEQIAIAIELGRSVSLHSVRAGGATVTLLEDLKREYPTLEEGLNKNQRKQLKKDLHRRAINESDGKSPRRCFRDINVDLHSCTLSAPMISQLQQKHPNLYVSFSIAINARQKDLHDQLKACDPKRLIIESDYHSAEDLGARCWQMIRLATDVLGDKLVDPQNDKEKRYIEAAKIFQTNWKRFIGEHCD
jgi:Tat protein secretion system quality control protein TatD with DNase activity